jgi:hypothetical protein
LEIGEGLVLVDAERAHEDAFGLTDEGAITQCCAEACLFGGRRHRD